jgi:hypothetical protein
VDSLNPQTTINILFAVKPRPPNLSAEHLSMISINQDPLRSLIIIVETEGELLSHAALQHANAAILTPMPQALSRKYGFHGGTFQRPGKLKNVRL